MSLALDPSASKVFVSKGLADPKLKKGAIKLADRVGALFLVHLATAASEIADEKKHKNVEPEDIIKALSNNGFEGYIDAFKKGMEEKEDEDESPKKKREKGDEKDKKGKKKD